MSSGCELGSSVLQRERLRPSNRTVTARAFRLVYGRIRLGDGGF